MIKLPWVKEHSEGVELQCYIQPQASKSEMAGSHGEVLKIRIKAPPVEGKANKELCRFLGGICGVRAGKIRVVSGVKTRTKRVLVIGKTLSEIHSLFVGYLKLGS